MGARAAVLVVEAGDQLTDAERAALAAADLVVERCAPSDAADRPALRALGEALAALRARGDVDAERVALLGLERGATLAFLHACQAGGAAAVALWGGELVRDALDAERPFQPLEMALGLEAPLLARVAADAPAGDAARLEHVCRTLSQFARPFDIVALPGAGARLAGDARAEALRATLAFLRDALELSPA